MAFPPVAGVLGSRITAAGTSLSVSLPDNSASGDLLLIVLRVAGAATGITWPASPGWTSLIAGEASDASNDVTEIRYRRVDGTEGWGGTGNTISVSWTGSNKAAALCWRITGTENPATQAPQISTVAVGTNDTPDPSGVTPAGGVAKDYLFIWVAGWDGELPTDVNLPPSGNPTNYTANKIATSTAEAGQPATNCRLASVTRELNSGATQDPGGWAVGQANAGWTAYTLCVHPVGAQSYPRTFSATGAGTLVAARTANRSRSIALAGVGTATASGARSAARSLSASGVGALATSAKTGPPRRYLYGWATDHFSEGRFTVEEGQADRILNSLRLGSTASYGRARSTEAIGYVDQFAKMVLTTIGAEGTHEHGFVFRANASDEVHYRVALTQAGVWRFVRCTGATEDQVIATWDSGAAIVAGDWIGATISGLGSNPTVKVWNWGNTNPDSAWPNVTNWGTPDHVFDSNNVTSPVDGGRFLGAWWNGQASPPTFARQDTHRFGDIETLWWWDFAASGVGTLTATGQRSKLRTWEGTGVGSLTLAAAHSTARTFASSGVGTFAASGVKSSHYERSVSALGVGALVASAQATRARSATASGVGSLTASAGHSIARAWSAAGIGSLVAVGEQAGSFQRSLAANGVGSLVAGFTAQHERSHASLGLGTLAASAQRTAPRSLAASGVGTLAATGQRGVPRTFSASGVGTLEATGDKAGSFQRSAVASGVGSLTAVFSRQRARSVTSAGVGTLAVSGQRVAPRAFAASGLGSLVAERVRSVPRTWAATGLGTLVATGEESGTQERTWSAAGTGSFATSRTVQRVRTADAAGSGTLVALGGKGNPRTALATGAGSLVATRLLSRGRVVEASGLGACTASITLAALRNVVAEGFGALDAPYTFGLVVTCEASGSGALLAVWSWGLPFARAHAKPRTRLRIAGTARTRLRLEGVSRTRLRIGRESQ